MNFIGEFRLNIQDVTPDKSPEFLN